MNQGPPAQRWDLTTDVVVVGSGGAGLVAALAAHDGGSSVVVLEWSPLLGGTTAVSGGMIWIANHHLMPAFGVSDSRQEALTYLRALAGDQADDALLEAFVAIGPELVRYLLDATPVRLYPIGRPDYHPDWPGGKPGGRTLDNRLFDAKQLGDLAAGVRKGPHFPPLTYEERHAWRDVTSFDWDLLGRRLAEDIRSLGGALVASLVRGCVDRGIALLANTRARRLETRHGSVVGLHAEQGGQPLAIQARQAVVIASGGFEWNDDMKRQFLRGPELAPVSPPWNFGDGICMGMAVGGALGVMNEAWWVPVVRIPGEEYDGRPMARHIIDERSQPGSLMVNRAGRRFVNEACNYNDLAKAFHTFDPNSYDYPNIPAYLVFDEAFKTRYAVATVMPDQPAPQWFARGDTLHDLARVAGISAEGLADTVSRFNRYAQEGADLELLRGATENDRYYGDARHGPNPCLGPVATPPFYAVEVTVGSLGTKGGLRTDALARVRHVLGGIVPRLYACGNAAASLTGAGYPGAGGTLGPALAFGYLAGRHAARETRCDEEGNRHASGESHDHGRGDPR